MQQHLEHVSILKESGELERLQKQSQGHKIILLQ